MSIADRAAHGVAWNIFTGVGARAIGLVGTLVLSRFMTPAEYGEVCAATICVMTAGWLANVNFGQYIIAKKATPDEVFHASVVHIILGAIALTVVYLLRDQLGPRFDAPTLGRYVPGMCVCVMLERIAYCPERTLVRDLRFRDVAMSRAAGELTFTGASLALAPHWGGMAIVYGNIARASLVTVLFIRASNRDDWLHPTRLRWATTRRLLVYCLPISLGGFAEFAAAKWDNMLVSRFFGASVMGMYNYAYNLADTPTGHVAEHIGDVLLPSFAQMEPGQRQNALLRSSALMALIVFPLAVGLGAIAPTLVSSFFDPRWAEVAPMLAILSVLSLVRPISWTLTAYTQSQQRPRTLMAIGLFKAVTVLALMITVGRLSPRWSCVAVGGAFFLYTAAYLAAIRVRDGLSVVRFVRGILPPLFAAAAMVPVVLGVRAGWQHLGMHTGWATLLLETSAGAIAYVVFALAIARSASQDLLGVARRVLKR